MKNKVWILLIGVMLIIAIAITACGGVKTSTTNPSSVTQTTTTTTTQTPTGTTTTTITTTTQTPTGTTTTTITTTTGTTTVASGKVLDIAALALEDATHPALYATLCMTCHGEGMGVQQYPMAPSWPGTTKTPGPWVVTQGSPADHTGRTDVATCMQSGCHKASWSTSTTPPTTYPYADGTSPEGGNGGIWTYIKSHPVEGFESCLTCHLNGTAGSLHQVNSSHNCDSCHQADPPIPGGSGYCPKLSEYPEDGTCLVCHYPPQS